MNRELLLNSMACNASFALEYFLLGREISDDLLRDGIKYCELITDASFEITPENIFKDEEKFERIETIQKYHTREKLIEYSKLASEVRKILIDILDKKDVKLSEEKIRSYQHFFNETSTIFLAGEMQKMRIRQEMRQKYRF